MLLINILHIIITACFHCCKNWEFTCASWKRCYVFSWAWKSGFMSVEVAWKLGFMSVWERCVSPGEQFNIMRLCNTNSRSHWKTHKYTTAKTTLYFRPKNASFLRNEPYLVAIQISNWNTLQHTAILCKSLQHTATHCNTQQYTALH